MGVVGPDVGRRRAPVAAGAVVDWAERAGGGVQARAGGKVGGRPRKVGGQRVRLVVVGAL